MTRLRELIVRAADVLVRRRRDERLSDELQTHLDLLADDYVARGFSTADARTAARRAFGNIDQVTAACRDQRSLPMIEAFVQDVGVAARLLARDRGFTLTATHVLGLGIGVNNMLFTVLNAHTIRGLPIDRVDRVAYVSSLDERGASRGVSLQDFEDFRAGTASFDGLAAFASGPVVVGDEGRTPERLEATYLTPNAFEVLRIRPAMGRLFSLEEDRAGGSAVVLLGARVWRGRYNSDPAILGRSIRLNGVPATVIGIFRDRSGFPSTAEVWLPLAAMPGLSRDRRDARTLRVFGRLREGVTLEGAAAEIDAIAGRLAVAHPATNAGLRAQTVPINTRFLGRLTDPAWMAFMTVGVLVLVISCANVANLLMDRGIQRQRELAIRASLGATRGRLSLQLLGEASVLAAIGGVLGLGLAAAGVRLFRGAIPANVLPYWLDYAIDWRVLAALIAASLATVFVAGLIPAVSTSKADVNRVLKDGGGYGPRMRAARRWTAAFLTAELALAVVMLSLLSLGVRVSAPPLPSDAVIDTTEVLTAALTLTGEPYHSAGQRAAFLRRLEERLGELPAVTATAFASALPLQNATERRLDIAGRPAPDAKTPSVWMVGVGPQYFETLGLPLLRGRPFSGEEIADAEPPAIVNDLVTRAYFGAADPIGQRIALAPPGAPASGGERTWYRIVGVAPVIRQRARPDPDPIVYLPLGADPAATSMLLVRSRLDGAGLASRLRDEVRALDPHLPLYRLQTMAGVVRDAHWNGRVSSGLFYTLTFIALALSTIGLYAVTSHAVSQRTPEIGLRMALGARPRQVRGLILRRVLGQLSLGLFVGMLCTVAWGRMFSRYEDITLIHPLSLGIVVAGLLGITVLACVVPVRRATRLDPLKALRWE